MIFIRQFLGDTPEIKTYFGNAKRFDVLPLRGFRFQGWVLEIFVKIVPGREQLFCHTQCLRFFVLGSRFPACPLEHAVGKVCIKS